MYEAKRRFIPPWVEVEVACERRGQRTDKTACVARMLAGRTYVTDGRMYRVFGRGSESIRPLLHARPDRRPPSATILLTDRTVPDLTAEPISRSSRFSVNPGSSFTSLSSWRASVFFCLINRCCLNEGSQRNSQVPTSHR